LLLNSIYHITAEVSRKIFSYCSSKSRHSRATLWYAAVWIFIQYRKIGCTLWACPCLAHKKDFL